MKILNEILRKIKHTKKLNAKRHLGKVKWAEDALEYQKRLRDEGAREPWTTEKENNHPHRIARITRRVFR